MTSQGVDLSRAAWWKSTYSGSNGGQCVEVAGNLPGIVAIRDSKNPEGAVLVIDVNAWRAFVRHVNDDGQVA